MTDCYPAFIAHDEPFLSLGPDERSAVSWQTLQKIVEKELPLVWQMHGEDRVVPLALLQDTWRLIQDYMKMVQIGRGTGIHVTPYGFTRQQTEPVTAGDVLRMADPKERDHDHILDPVNPQGHR